MSLEDALKRLDVSNDNHWTAEGVPRLDTVKLLSADPSVTRDRIETEFPGFNRNNAQTYVKPEVKSTDAQNIAGSSTSEVSPSGSAIAFEEAVNRAAEIAATFTIEDLQAKQEHLAEVVAGLEKGLAYKAKLVQEIDAMLEYFAENGAAETEGEKIQGYLQSQLAIREKQAARNKELSEAGITRELLKTLVPQKVPIDEALANRRR